ncbi:MAG: SMC family ATPase, partial [Anaerolineales bacterium]|nr:SMC family ATPase [Anaerolineales bacterium]
MIPIKLRLSGFLSYRDTTELDFTGFDLACISGQNGAGKSSLLDAMTWALFGQARKRDEALINQQSKAAEVTFTFGYEQNVYRIQRSMPQGKTTLLEFQIQTADDGWRPLTEHSLRETQKRIEQVLRLDYETFVNAAFFLQGKADQFTQQNAGKRKEVLSNVLGLEIWETYKDMTAERRKALQQEQDSVDGRLAEIKAELDEEPARKIRLAELETELGRLTTARKTQETALDNIRRLTASLKEQRNLVTSLAAQLERSSQKLTDIETRLSARQVEREEYIELQARATDVETNYQAWQASRLELERWDRLADQFHEQD